MVVDYGQLMDMMVNSRSIMLMMVVCHSYLGQPKGNYGHLMDTVTRGCCPKQNQQMVQNLENLQLSRLDILSILKPSDSPSLAAQE